jgi:phosphoribosylformylglycinamidine synthase
VIGKITGSRKLVLFYQDVLVGEIDMNFIFDLPKLEKKAAWIQKKENDFKLKSKKNYNDDLKSLLSRPNIASKDWILREYDHEVQAGSVLKSIYGIKDLSISDASVLRPDLKSKKCIAIGLGINPFYSDIDPYHMASLSIEEALRNVIAVGGNLKKTYILDNFSWGSPQDKETLGGLVRAAFSCYDFSKYFKVPFISGKDSLYNEYDVEEKRISIPGTLLVSAISVIDDWQKVITGSFKKEGNLVYIVGFTKAELGTSEYFRSLGIKEGLLPKVDTKISKRILEALGRTINKGLVLACHDLSEGGLGVAIAEMCIGSDLGVNIFLEELPAIEGMRDYEILFSESASRFIVEVETKKKKKFEEMLGGLPFGLIGCISRDKKIAVYAKGSKEIINLDISELRKAWTETFSEFKFNIKK